MSLPSGTVTFLLTDIEDSSVHWEDAPDEMRAVLGAHDSIALEVVDKHDGTIVKHMGDGCWAAFQSAPNAAAAAVDIQQRIQMTDTDTRHRLRVRIGLHTGEIEPTGDDYFGSVVNRMARIADLANGDQIVCSATTAALLDGWQLIPQGWHELKGIGSQEVHLLHDDAFVSDDRPLRRPVTESNLPKPTTSFLGREELVGRAADLLTNDQRLLTLVGPGGVGKTRVGIEVGAAVAPHVSFVQFCDLAPVGEAEAVPDAVANAVGARQQQGLDLTASIADFFAGREALLVLDSCEHVIDAVRSLVTALLDTDGLRILVTSREALGMPDERLLSVPPLPAASVGIELFVDRAKHVDDTFELDDDNRDAVVELVTRLDGIPLAIELAAAQVRLMTPAELLDRLDDRFQLLGGGRRRERFETLRATVRWSYDLLTESEAALFARMSVFSGGATLDSIAAVCGHDIVEPDDVPALVLALVDKSMVVSSLIDGRRRFTMLETLRRFGEEILAEAGTAGDVRRRHADHHRALAIELGDQVWSASEPDAWKALDREWANLRTAVDTFEALDAIDEAADLVLALVWYATLAMRFELYSWAEELLTTPDITDRPSYPDLCGAAALGAYFTVSGDVAALAGRGLEADRTDPRSLCRTALAAVFLNSVHTPEQSDAVTREWLDAAPATVGGQLWAHGFRAFHLCSHAPSREAATQVGAATKIAQETGSLSARAVTAWAQGMVVAIHDRDRAITIWRDALEEVRSMPREHLVEHLLVGLLLHFTVQRDELHSVLIGCRDALQVAVDDHYHVGTSHLFGVTAIALSRAGDAATGATLLGAMVGNGQLPRGNALRTIEAALGDEKEIHELTGLSMGITKAAGLALEALDTAIAATPTS